MILFANIEWLFIVIKKKNYKYYLKMYGKVNLYKLSSLEQTKLVRCLQIWRYISA